MDPAKSNGIGRQEGNASREPREAGERRGAERPLRYSGAAAKKAHQRGRESQQRQDAKRQAEAEDVATLQSARLPTDGRSSKSAP